MSTGMVKIFILLASAIQLYSQTQTCSFVPPKNQYLADSPYPIFHGSGYCQSSVCLRGPETTDSLYIKTRTNIAGGTSPWIYFTDTYPDGKRAILYANSNYGFKFLDTDTGIVTVDSIQIDMDPLTNGYNFLQTRNKVWYIYNGEYDPAKNRYSEIYRIEDVNPNDPYSKLKRSATYNFGTIGLNRVYFSNIAYDGNIIFTSDNDTDKGYATVGVLSPDLKLIDTLHYALSSDEMNSHNSNPVDENNNFYVLTNKRLICFAWNGKDLSLSWSAWYDFVGDGPKGKFANGSGTTPTLIGWGEGNDKLLVMADGHAHNNLVAFWREIPKNWTPKPGMDPRFADSIRIPLAEKFSELYQSIENSPCALGYDIGVQQCNGFLKYSCTDHLNGVQKIRWDTTKNELSVVWVNSEINMNSVLTVSAGSNIVYGSGMEDDCNYYYYGIDWTTGKTVIRKKLGPVDRLAVTLNKDTFFDGGDQNIIDEKGNIFYSGGSSLVKIGVVRKTQNIADFKLMIPSPKQVQLKLKGQSLYVFGLNQPGSVVKIFNSVGKLVLADFNKQNKIDICNLESGMYYVEIEGGNLHFTNSFVKK